MQQLPDFDQLAELAQRDPDALESLRERLTRDLIASAPADMQRRLQGLQFQVDAQRALAKNPMDSCIRISRMMQDSLLDLRDALQGHRSPDVDPAAGDSELASAEVIAFPGSSRADR